MNRKGLSERSNITDEKAEKSIQKYSRAYPQGKNTLQQLGIKIDELPRSKLRGI